MTAVEWNTFVADKMSALVGDRANVTIAAVRAECGFGGAATVTLTEGEFYRALQCWFVVNSADASGSMLPVAFDAWKTLMSGIVNIPHANALFASKTVILKDEWENFSNDVLHLYDVSNDNLYTTAEFEKVVKSLESVGKTGQFTHTPIVGASSITTDIIRQNFKAASPTTDNPSSLAIKAAIETAALDKTPIHEMLVYFFTPALLRAAAHPDYSLIYLHDKLYITDCDYRETHNVEECLSTVTTTFTAADSCEDIRKKQQQFVDCAYSLRPQCCMNLQNLVSNDLFGGSFEDKCWTSEAKPPLYCPSKEQWDKLALGRANGASSMRAPVFLAVVIGTLQVAGSYLSG